MKILLAFVLISSGCAAVDDSNDVDSTVSDGSGTDDAADPVPEKPSVEELESVTCNDFAAPDGWVRVGCIDSTETIYPIDMPTKWLTPVAGGYHLFGTTSLATKMFRLSNSHSTNQTANFHHGFANVADPSNTFEEPDYPRELLVDGQTGDADWLWLDLEENDFDIYVEANYSGVFMPHGSGGKAPYDVSLNPSNKLAVTLAMPCPDDVAGSLAATEQSINSLNQQRIDLLDDMMHEDPNSWLYQLLEQQLAMNQMTIAEKYEDRSSYQHLLSVGCS